MSETNPAPISKHPEFFVRKLKSGFFVSIIKKDGEHIEHAVTTFEEVEKLLNTFKIITE